MYPFNKVRYNFDKIVYTIFAGLMVLNISRQLKYIGLGYKERRSELFKQEEINGIYNDRQHVGSKSYVGKSNYHFKENVLDMDMFFFSKDIYYKQIITLVFFSNYVLYQALVDIRPRLKPR